MIFRIKNFNNSLFSKRPMKAKEERIASDLMAGLQRCRRRVSRETKIAAVIFRLRDEICNKEHLVPRVADPSCEGRPFLVDACPRIVTPAYAKPRPRMLLPGLRGSSPFASLFSDAFLPSSRVVSSPYLVTDRIFPSALRRETIKMWGQAENMA